MDGMKNVFLATNTFVKGFPINRYVLLFHFDDISVGAWEHSYSSEYIFKETELTPQIVQYIGGIAAHEIFHMVTPLNIHSEITEEFNFVTPTPSQHLWLYEGVTEWSSDMIQLRGELITLEEVLALITEKLTYNDQFDKNYSLQKLSLTSYTPEGQKEYVNIYNRGALVPLIMDIFLLEKNGGNRGLREVIVDLTKKYGTDKSFSEANFFTEFVAMTHPEMQAIIDSYIINAEPLPIKAYFNKLGIDYEPETKSGEIVPDRGHTISFDGSNFIISDLQERSELEGLKLEDILQEVNGIPTDQEHFEQLIPVLQGIQAGDTVTYKIVRKDETLTLKTTVGSKESVDKHVFSIKDDATPEQLALREVWMKNLD
jgi:predicted metalloprotease with PDZ domain